MSETKTFLLSNSKTVSIILDSGIDIGQGINVRYGRFDKNNEHRALNKRRAWKIWQTRAYVYFRV